MVSKKEFSPEEWETLIKDAMLTAPPRDFAKNYLCSFPEEEVRPRAPLTITTTKPREAPTRVMTDKIKGIHPSPGGFSYFMSGRRAGKSHADKLFADMLIDAGKIAVFGNDVEFMIMDELDNDMSKTPAVSSEAKAALAALADKMTQYFATVPTITSLLGSASLTVDQPGKGYRKKGHVGGEDFKFSSVRIGSEKAGARLIFVLTPEAAAEYTAAEFTEDEAAANLSAFRQAADNAAGGDFIRSLREIRSMDTKVRDAEVAVEKMKDYREFGSW